MLARKIGVISLVVGLTVINNTFAAGKPLKIFIVAGQSNAQGKAQVFTIERLNLTDDSKQMYQDMAVKDGLPSAVKDAYGVYYTDGGIASHGPLKPGYGERTSSDTRFGPDYTFGIYMQKHLNEPFLIIKTAWGGKDLLHDFRPPSAGPLESAVGKSGKTTGHYYQEIIKGVNEVLADPGKYHPGYKQADGYEIAGFVWFQGWNDYVGRYPEKNKMKDYSEYSRLLACFIRDVRKDLKAPAMPFVIGVVGFGGPIENPKDNQSLFRKAQEAPASLPEFARNVIAVRTENCWDMEFGRINKKVFDAAKADVLARDPAKKGLSLNRAAEKLTDSMAPKVLTPEEQKILKVGKSNAGYHYLGSAYIYGNIGKVLAEGMIKLEQKK
jgi:hypothetical protein